MSSSSSPHNSGALRQVFLVASLLLALPVAITAADTVDQPLAQRSLTVADTVTGILSYARWPETESNKRLCVAGPTEYADLVLQRGPPAEGWDPQVQRVSVDHPRLTSACQALYIGRLSPQQLQRLFVRLDQQQVLSISEHDQWCAVGSMFCLRFEAGSTAFEVNLDSIARSGVKIHPNVLRLGRRTDAPL